MTRTAGGGGGGAGLRAFATRPHYLDHIAPVWAALGCPGAVLVERDLLGHRTDPSVPTTAAHRGSGTMLVAGYADLFRARRMGYGPFVLMQHGAGQSYGGDPRSARNQSYAGGIDHDDVALFLVPGPHPAARWREAYPRARVVEVGNPKPLPDMDDTPRENVTVAVTFHFPLGLIPETRSSWTTFREALPAIAERWKVIGHWHPRWGDALRRQYEAVGIEPVATLAEVARRADVLVADNTSALFEFAATDRPVVVLNGPTYRKDVHHGLRFWEASSVGIHCDRPDGLMGAIRLALLDPPGLRESRAVAVGMVYVGGGAKAAADAIDAM